MVLSNYDTEELVVEDVLTKEAEQNTIILFNDDVNTFEWVIECLMKYCGHDSLQAEQCAYIVHYTGKCGVKKGSLATLEPICSALLQKGLSAEIN
jgi:ATP-dependent Clp protease adaptor protein ClpS